MWKNVVIGILLVFSLFFFFFGLTQQIKAEQAMDLYKSSERESLILKEELHVAQVEIERQGELLKSKVKQAQ